MDPAAAILASILHERPRLDVIQNLAGWYRNRGYHPTLAQVAAIAKRQGSTLPRNWKHSARSLGAVE